MGPTAAVQLTHRAHGGQKSASNAPRSRLAHLPPGAHCCLHTYACQWRAYGRTEADKAKAKANKAKADKAKEAKANKATTTAKATAHSSETRVAPNRCTFGLP